MARKPRPKADGPHKYDIAVGQRLRQARLLAGMSQTRLAEQVNLTFQQVQKYEKGMNRIGASRLQEFSQILNVTPSFFFENGAYGDTQIAELLQPEGSNVDSRQTAELIRNFKRIENAEIRAKLAAAIKAVADGQAAA